MRIKRFKDISEDTNSYGHIQHRQPTKDDKIQKMVEYELEKQPTDLTIEPDKDLSIDDIENLYKQNKHLFT